LPTESFRVIVQGLLDGGMGEAKLRRMVHENPGELLGLT
jgi:hypothetical protein